MKGLLFISHQTAKYNCIQSVEVALKGGCRQIQLRMKETARQEAVATAQQVKALCRQYQAVLFIDDYVDVCRLVQANGVHLGKTDMHPAEARRILGKEYIIGGTANTFEDIQHLAATQAVDYIGLGPFRFTETKKNLSPVLGLEGCQTIISRCRESGINLPVIAIGGITKEDIPAILDAGASGIALSSTILNAGNPVEETREIIRIIQCRLFKESPLTGLRFPDSGRHPVSGIKGIN
jgi:thiamine-phosphate pyrophosphorylase